MVIAGEMGEALFEGLKAALGLSVMTLRVEGDGATTLQAAVDMLEERRVVVKAPVDGDIAANRPDDGPLDAMRHEHRGVAQEVDPWLARKAGKDGEGVEPVEVVGDDQVSPSPGNVLATGNRDPKQEMENRQGQDPQNSIGEGCLALDR